MRTFSSASHLPPTLTGHTWPVSTFLKVALGLLLTLPLGAYIAGTLVASQASMPAERRPVVIEATTSDTPSATPSRSPSRTPEPTPDDHGGERGDDHGGGDDDESVHVVRPTPREVDDDHDDRLDDRADEAEDRADDRADEQDERDDDSADDD